MALAYSGPTGPRRRLADKEIAEMDRERGELTIKVSGLELAVTMAQDMIESLAQELNEAKAQRDAEQNRIDAIARATREAIDWRDSVGQAHRILDALLDALCGALDIEPRADA